MKNIIIGCDNAGYLLKTELISALKNAGYKFEDVGCYSEEDKVMYPVIAQKVCQNIIASGYKKRGILICGTGLGMCISANKFIGIRAGVCHDIFSAERLVLSNNGNVFCFGQRVIGKELAKKILFDCIELSFVDGPSSPKVKCISDIEKNTMIKS